MSIADIQRLDRSGHRVVPDLADYDGSSPGWSEVEYRGHPRKTGSIAGFWEGEPGWVAIDSWPYNEVCVILSGRIAVEDAEGQSVEFAAGEAFLIPAGFVGIWHTLAPTRKVFVGLLADSPSRRG